jgi:hypothetical protein
VSKHVVEFLGSTLIWSVTSQVISLINSALLVQLRQLHKTRLVHTQRGKPCLSVREESVNQSSRVKLYSSCWTAKSRAASSHWIVRSRTARLLDSEVKSHMAVIRRQQGQESYGSYQTTRSRTANIQWGIKQAVCVAVVYVHHL